MNILKIAFSQLGIKEISGSEDHPQIIKYAEETHIESVTNDEIPWCSTFVNWCAQEAGLPISGKANARSWLNVGKRISSPEPGDIVIFWRESPHSWKGHVAIFLGFNKTSSRVYCLGGNQGDAVSISDYDAKKVLAYQRLEFTHSLKIPKPILKRDDKKPEVIKLQFLLNHLQYHCGDADGDFGEKTENAIKLLQANNRLDVNGVYQAETQNIMESLMQA